MDRFLVRKDIYDEIEKAMRDRSHLIPKKITDKNGHQRTVMVRPGEDIKGNRQKKVEEPTEKRTAKPQYKVGDSVTLDGAKGDFKVSSIDKDGTYHVVSADGKTGYRVSENHMNGSEKVSVGNREMTADNKKVSDKLDEITGKLDKEKDSSKRKELLEQMKDIQQNGTKSKHFEQKTESKEPEKTKEARPKKEVSLQVKMKRKEQQKKEKEKYDYNKRMNDFYVNTGLDGGPEAVLYRQAVEKEENKQPNLRAGSRDDSIFEENDEVQFWRSGNYIDGKIAQVKEDWNGQVSLQVESNGNKYWVETEDIIKHPASTEEIERKDE